MNRIKPAIFGSEVYAKEDLVAEIGAVFLASELQVGISFDKSVAYLQGWLRALRNDPKMIIHASAQAEKAINLIMNR